MLYEVFKLSDNTECDYESYAFTMTIGELIAQAHSSNIQRMRNPKKEEGIMKFTKESIDKKRTPFFQPFILHYNGKVNYKDGKYILDAVPTFKVQIEDYDGLEEREFEFEVIDGNGRLNSMIRLNQAYIAEILKQNECLNVTEDFNKIKRLENRVYDLKTKNKTLKDIKIVIQLYVNLTDEQKTKLFNSVNQGEKMSLGRLKVYNNEKIENQLLSKYIGHTENIDFPYIITPDKDSLRTESDRKKYVPAVFILPVIRKLIKYCKLRNIQRREDFIYDILDMYITESNNPPHLRKHFFSILGTVIDTAIKYESDLDSYVMLMLEFDYTRYEDVSKELKRIRADIVTYVFDGSNKVEIL
ncbi:hypothetical protein FDG50_07750 [Clostridium botulinum]|uniref:hypothetical protein n=1 Tax=Clostridium botulinum TaxID=1491 RepID=UPI001400653A|nr:hypothetical protein [Clostridium botulinum]MBY6838321.1 hypothetical protein [Clostridium botulinum]NFG64998.1 hypothetical protein [Clostridium botulinum]NFQ24012.1 hypothetical protein [Clostridium botulinum]